MEFDRIVARNLLLLMICIVVVLLLSNVIIVLNIVSSMMWHFTIGHTTNKRAHGLQVKVNE